MEMKDSLKAEEAVGMFVEKRKEQPEAQTRGETD